MPFQPHRLGVTVSLRVTPGASRAALGGVMDMPDGKRALRAAVTAPPEDGKANKALVALLAKTWKIPKSAMTVVSGETGRQKVLLVEGESGALMRKLTDWLARAAAES